MKRQGYAQNLPCIIFDDFTTDSKTSCFLFDKIISNDKLKMHLILRLIMWQCL